MSRAAASAAVVSLLGACATGPSELPAAAGDPFLEPAAGRAVIVVSREPASAGGDCTHRISIDGREVAALRPGGWVTLYPAPGEHVIGVVRVGTACAGGGETRLTLAAGRDQRLRTADAAGNVSLLAVRY